MIWLGISCDRRLKTVAKAIDTKLQLAERGQVGVRVFRYWRGHRARSQGLIQRGKKPAFEAAAARRLTLRRPVCTFPTHRKAKLERSGGDV